MPEMNPGEIFLWTFVLAAVSGFAYCIRQKEALTYRMCLSTALNSGLFGVAAAMGWWEWNDGPAHPWGMMCVSILCGLGGVKSLDFLLSLGQEAAKLLVLHAAEKAGKAVKGSLDKSVEDLLPTPPEPPEDPTAA